ncbi:tRNA lysidine(34) synthetase TilS [Stappia sp. GBMRC 2046]|uniref:tRNA(Ile)-lysidine synthase n=1 Tax=Stappia sediminis TaxID=2692190 RepID=A0A7X3S825_9HYPH|nr:tRNA lysidine(34) synthetase TilS [Stappia sediminis]MXN65401.1 tRNA lysidine(34) synthetase TilS [Stappia sediminis]
MSDAVDSNAPLEDEEIRGLLAPLAGVKRIAVGVSGGPDSLALLYILSRWRAEDRSRGIVAFTVDHGLRPEAADEAAHVAAVCRSLAISHEILKWQGPKPDADVQAAARKARQDLLVGAARKAGADALALAHHRDDQAETFLLRLARGSGVYGLGAMRGETHWDAMPVFRPLLDVPKSRLIGTLRRAGIGWCEDPSNEDARYARARIRKLMPLLAREGLTAERLSQTANRLARAADALDVWTSGVIGAGATVHPAGPVKLLMSIFDGMPAEIRYRVFSRVLRFVGGGGYAPRFEKLQRLCDDLLAGTERKATLAGAVLYREGDCLYCWREPGREGIEAMEIAGPDRRVWDGRFFVEVPRHSSVRIAALGKGGLRRLGLERPKGWPAGAFEASPALEMETGGGEKREIAVPGIADAVVPSGWRFGFVGSLAS